MDTQPKIAQPAPSPANDALPNLQKTEATPPQAHVGIFNPNMVDYPTLHELISVLGILGLRTGIIYSNNEKGDMVAPAGNVIVPAKLVKFFAFVPTIIPNQA